MYLYTPNGNMEFLISPSLSGSSVVPVSEWKCRLACLGRAVVVQADAILTPTTGVISVGTGDTMPMTAIASTREEAAAVAGMKATESPLIYEL